MEYLTTTEMSEIWDISPRRIAILCAQGRIDSVVKKGKTWLISSDAQKPNDARRKEQRDVEL